MCSVSRKAKQIWIDVVIVAALLPIVLGCAYLSVFDYCAGRVQELVGCRTRAEIVAKLPKFRERTLEPGETPVWRFLNVPPARVPKDVVSREYRLFGLPGLWSAICVAYDRNDRVVGVYEYD